MVKNIILLILLTFNIMILNYTIYLQAKLTIITGDALSVVNNIREICDYFTEQEYEQAKQFFELEVQKQ